MLRIRGYDLNGKQISLCSQVKPFTFNVVFEPEAKQDDVLEHSGIKRLIDMALDGFSATCFCYGQTGSGKTHTLTGPPYMFNQRTANGQSKAHNLTSIFLNK